MDKLLLNVNKLINDIVNTNWSLIFYNIAQIYYITYQYELLLIQSIVHNKPYNEITIFSDDTWAKVQVFSLSLIFKLWDKPHYRSKSFQQDMIDNLRNVTIPGIGIPLSVFVYHIYISYVFIFVFNPIICFFGSIITVVLSFYANQTNDDNEKVSHTIIDDIVISNEWISFENFIVTVCKLYIKYLIHPNDWFSLWRLNCRLISYHSNITNSIGYKQEDKWTFLTYGYELGVPVSPFLQIDSIVCKNKNIEGGMGIHFFKNAAHGGDWIIQETLSNCDWLKALLPLQAPLSTMRIITSSIYPRSTNKDYVLSLEKNLDIVKSTSNGVNHDISKYIKPLSAVLRLGRAGALTDHTSIFYNIDLKSHKITHGSTNSHWYQIGLWKNLSSLWSSKLGLDSGNHYDIHPDPPNPQVVGKLVPDMDKAIKIVTESHFKMMKDVPLVGWDVAFTTEGIFLLEVNLSCNFFQGDFDMSYYIKFMNDYFIDLQLYQETKKNE